MNLRYRMLRAVAIFMLLITLLASCSSSQQISAAPGAVPVSEQIPASLKLLSEISDNKSIEYEIASYEAATDLINLGKNALRGRDSGQALRLLTIGARLMPWRSDVVQLRDTALRTYIENTNVMIAKGAASCVSIIDRVQYLNTIAPDGLSSLENYNLACPNNHIQVKSKLALEDGDFISLLQKSLPASSQDLAVEDRVDLSVQLQKILERNNKFPTEDLLILGFNYFRLAQMKNRVVYDRFEIPSDATNENTFTLEAIRREIENKETVIPDNVIEARRAYCSFLLGALGNTQKQMTLNELNSSSKKDDQGVVMCLSDKQILADTTTTVLREKYYDYFLETPRASRIAALVYKPKHIISRRVIERAEKSQVSYYLGTPPVEKNIKLDVDKQFVTGLVKIYYEIDFYNTYKMYRDVLTGNVKSFDEWWMAFHEDKI